MENNARTAIVTGGSRGIGRAICVALAEKKVNLVVCYAGRADAAEETVRLCREKGAQAIAVQADVSKAEDVTRLVDETKNQFGRVDILVNNAGITRDDLLMRMSEDSFDAVLATNLKGAFLCTKAVSRLMLKGRFGRIINISSVVGLFGNAGQANYAASKAGLIGFTKSVAKEFGGKGITANAVAPGFIETDMTAVLAEDTRNAMIQQIPAKAIGKPEDVAAAVCFLASEEAGYITGQVLAVDGGMAM